MCMTGCATEWESKKTRELRSLDEASSKDCLKRAIYKAKDYNKKILGKSQICCQWIKGELAVFSSKNVNFGKGKAMASLLFIPLVLWLLIDVILIEYKYFLFIDNNLRIYLYICNRGNRGLPQPLSLIIKGMPCGSGLPYGGHNYEA